MILKDNKEVILDAIAYDLIRLPVNNIFRSSWGIRLNCGNRGIDFSDLTNSGYSKDKIYDEIYR